MTNETRQRIKFYQEALPKMKEKVIAAAMMLIIAISVTITSTYAWITLSTAPEVTSVDTTVVANGSLEIALANGTGKAPGKSAVGDSTGAGTEITAANVTWGNLVNLSDPSYGLTKITLRPAALNGTSGLLTNPLYGVGYGADGRVSSMVTDDDFAYVYYDQTSGTNGAFLADLDGSHLGVRAISTVKYENLEGDNTLAELLGYVNQHLTLAKNNYSSMTNESQEPGKSYIASLEGLIQIYAQNVIDRKSTSALDITGYVPDLYEMMKYFKESVMMPAGESYVQMANMLELMLGSGSADAGYTVESLVAASKAGSLPSYIGNNISSLASFSTDYNALTTYLKESKTGDFSDLTVSQKNNSLAYWAYYAQNGGKVYWSNLNNHISWICDINTATLDGYTLSSLSNVGNASKILTGGNPHDAIINGGAIYRMEQRIGQKMSPTISVSVDASSIVSFLGKVNMEAILTTSAIDPYDMTTDRDNIKSKNTGSFKGDTATAEDTYAMAIDLWVRTNAGSDGEPTTEEVTETLEDGTVKTTLVTTSPEKAYLTLEGAVVMGEEEVQVTIEDLNGEKQPAYTASFSIDGEAAQLEVFKRYGTYYYLEAETQREYDLEAELKTYQGEVSEVTYTPRVEMKNVVVGYEGVNRVWNEEQMMGYGDEAGGNITSATSTTQGGGSCYVFYANTPADQSRFLELLKSMRVVFVNNQGRQIGFASLDTTNYFAETGKVTVPLVLDKTQAIDLGTDLNGNEIYGLTALEKNVATRITALIYLDGTRLTNDMVLASGDIQGTLNIQFGSSAALMRTTVITESKTEGETSSETKDTTIDYVSGKDSVSIKDEEVMKQFVDLSASVTKDTFEYDPEKDASTTLNVTIDGISKPRRVAVRFMRAISSTQGVLQDFIELNGSDSNWSTTCTFDRPGNYVLRSVWVDGVEYSLPKGTEVQVTVKGSAVNSLTCDAITDASNQATIMTANSSFSTNMKLGFTSSKEVPNRVNGIFVDEDGRQVDVSFTLSEGEWYGTAKFTTSGTFTMKYVEIDGDIYELQESLQPTIEILLGLKVRTWITASEEMLQKLQSVLETALATNFVLDKAKTGDVTLNVSAEIYDNIGNEITGLGNVKLYYGREGSSVLQTGLDSDMKWDNASGRYIGAFDVLEPGTYIFSKVTVGRSEIESYTLAPRIQAMPPEDAYYFNNYTNSYQYAPNADAKMTIGIAYSNAASKITATITNGTIVQTVEGVRGGAAEDQGDKSVNLWSFKIPETNGFQEGVWTLTGITMYGVYYEDVYYDAQGAGVNIDLRNENIQAKVVNYLNVTLNVGEEREFTGYFMDSHNVNDMTVTIEDYEGKAVEGITISDLKVVYLLDAESVTMDAYGYEADGLDTVNVSGEGTLKEGSLTVYNISTMNFQYVGQYKHCSVSFAIDGVNVTAGTINSGTKLRFAEKGKQLANMPVYSVSWTAPTVKITGINPAYGSTFTITASGDSDVLSGNAVTQSLVTNWISDDQYAAVMYLAYESGLIKSFTAPKVKLTLSDAGSNFSNLSLQVPKGVDADNPQTYSFTKDNQTVEKSIGQAESSYVVATQHNEIGKQTISRVSLTGKDGRVWSAKLSKAIILNEQGTAPELTFTGLDGYEGATTPGTVRVSSKDIILSQDGSNSFKYTLPAAQSWKQKLNEVENTGDGEGAEPQKSVVYWEEKVTSGSGCNQSTTTYYHVYDRTVTVTTSEAIEREYELSYILDQWKISNKSYNAGTEVTVSGKWTAVAAPRLASKNLINEETVTSITTYTIDVSQGERTTTKPSGATKVNESDISTSGKTDIQTTQK